MTERDGELRLATLKSAAKALKVLHQNDIIHKGLKPSNIMLLDDNKSFAIIDFGISSVFEEGSTERNYAWRHSLNAKKRNIDYTKIFGLIVIGIICICYPVGLVLSLQWMPWYVSVSYN